MIREYMKDTSGELWWCNSHGRRATYVYKQGNSAEQYHQRDSKLGGITLPCFCVNLTGMIEIEDE